MNLKDIADGIAARFLDVVATNGSLTQTASATADMPNQVATLALLVYPPTGSLKIIMGPKIDDEYLFPVKLLLDPIDMPTRSKWLLAWATALRTRMQTSWSLGIAGVSQAEAIAMRVDFDAEPYASAQGGLQQFDVVEITVRVNVYEIAIGVLP